MPNLSDDDLWNILLCRPSRNPVPDRAWIDTAKSVLSSGYDYGEYDGYLDLFCRVIWVASEFHKAFAPDDYNFVDGGIRVPAAESIFEGSVAASCMKSWVNNPESISIVKFASAHALVVEKRVFGELECDGKYCILTEPGRVRARKKPYRPSIISIRDSDTRFNDFCMFLEKWDDTVLILEEGENKISCEQEAMPLAGDQVDIETADSLENKKSKARVVIVIKRNSLLQLTVDGTLTETGGRFSDALILLRELWEAPEHKLSKSSFKKKHPAYSLYKGKTQLQDKLTAEVFSAVFKTNGNNRDIWLTDAIYIEIQESTPKR